MKPLIIVPAYNVANYLSKVLVGLSVYKSNTVVIDDGSNDETLNVIKSYKFNHISHSENQGMGNAIKTGIAYGLDNSYTHAICLDSDGQHNSNQVVDFIEELKENDLVLDKHYH